MDEVLQHALHSKDLSEIFKNKDYNIVMEELYPKKETAEEVKNQPVVAH